MPLPEQKSPEKVPWLRPLRSNTTNLSTVGPVMRRKDTVPRSALYAKALTVSVRPVARRVVGTAILGQISRNITPISQPPTHRTQAAGLENCAAISAPKNDHNPSISKLKLKRQKRVSIIPKTGVISLFSPEPSLAQDQSGVISDIEYDSSPTPRSRHPENLPLQGCFFDNSTIGSPPHTALQSAKIQSSLTVPCRRPEKGEKIKVPSKSVRWDPAILDTESRHQFVPDEQLGIAKSTSNIDALDQNTTTNGLDAKDCVETIREWKKSDRERLEYLLRALRELDSVEESCKVEKTFMHSDPKEKVIITAVKSLDPRVPDFKPIGKPEILSELDCSNHTLQLQKHTLAKEHQMQNKENIPPQTPAIIPSLPKCAARKRSICDDYGAPGREVDAFDQWYAEKQLIEFMKKYPMTGKKAPAVKYRMPAKRRAEVMATSGPTAGRHAAVIQQRLEFLLLKNKERKAMEGMHP